jgi:3-oxocholest-4-en-26-oyl-CoA dehydrogenase beta subunit
MDFTFTEEQETISKLARDVFERRATPEHLTEVESGAIRYDAALWKELASVDLLGIALPESVGGSRSGSDGGDGFVELGVLLAEVGWSVAPVPAFATLVLGADPIARHGTPEQQQRFLPGVIAGERIMSAGLSEPGRSDPAVPSTTARRDGSRWRLDGAKELVPAAQLADTVLIPATRDDGDTGLFLLSMDTPGVEVRPVRTTNGEPHADVFLDGATVSADDRLEGSVESLHTRALIGLCAIQLGVVERALRIAATYTTQREQFGRPIGSFQAVQQRMADAFIDVEAIRWTTWHAAWLVSQGHPAGRPAERAARIAKFWAAEGGSRVAATTQHVHGGIGIDTTYPLHRYFLWAKHNELTLGPAPLQLARLGSTYSFAPLNSEGVL